MDTFDRIIGSMDGIPGVHKTRPTTIATVQPMLGNSSAHVVQTYSTEEGLYVFIQQVGAEGSVRMVLPPKVAEAIYRQRDAVVKVGRKSRARQRWADMDPDVKAERIAAARERLAKSRRKPKA